ncbi:amidohydrolase [Luteibaculum oceani]|uniref:Amidohydrolase n=1 Tax=Luteibaculum oceani TaxID=1294296 RepID=A0A5C6V218_9FLAO|nr:amidohydrolase [Luteibaculum oceani]TXC78476.1 amidohydrolase [Luteibaculum oceani]
MNKIVFTLLVLCTVGCGFKSEKADLIIHNAKIYSLDEQNSVHQAIAIRGDSIVALGAEREILNKFSGKQIDAKGATLYPGFIDAHSHLYGYSLTQIQLDLKGVKSESEMLAKIAAFKKANPTLKAITGRGWDESEWPTKKLPSRTRIDSIVPNIPLLLGRVDGHSAIVNKAALDLADFNSETTIEGGYVDYNNGILKEVAVQVVADKLPFNITDFDKLINRGANNCIEAGLTTVCDAGLPLEVLKNYQDLAAKGNLPVRLYAMAEPSQENFHYYKTQGTVDEPFFKQYAVKAYADGSLGSRSAALIGDYHDDEGNSGILTTSPDSLEKIAELCDALGLQLNTHCIGDRALNVTLNAYSKFLKPNNDKRWRIEHVQVVQESDLDLFGKLGVVPSVQPTHATSDAKWAAERLGPNRLNLSYAYQTLTKQLGWIALGTDFPVEDIDPIATFYSAVFREDIGGKLNEKFLAEEALTREQALRGITIWAALSMHMEDEVGSLETGKKADLVLLNTDLLEANPEAIKNTSVLLTIIGGKVVFKK